MFIHLFLVYSLPGRLPEVRRKHVLAFSFLPTTKIQLVISAPVLFTGRDVISRKAPAGGSRSSLRPGASGPWMRRGSVVGEGGWSGGRRIDRLCGRRAVTPPVRFVTGHGRRRAVYFGQVGNGGCWEAGRAVRTPATTATTGTRRWTTRAWWTTTTTARPRLSRSRITRRRGRSSADTGSRRRYVGIPRFAPATGHRGLIATRLTLPVHRSPRPSLSAVVSSVRPVGKRWSRLGPSLFAPPS